MSSASVTVAGIPSSTDESSIRSFFSFCGDIKNITFSASEPRLTIIEYQNEEQATACLLLDQSAFLDGSKIRISLLDQTPVSTPAESSATVKVIASILASSYLAGRGLLDMAARFDKEHQLSEKTSSFLKKEFDVIDARIPLRQSATVIQNHISHAAEHLPSKEDVYLKVEEIKKRIGSSEPGKIILESSKELSSFVGNVSAEANRIIGEKSPAMQEDNENVSASVPLPMETLPSQEGPHVYIRKSYDAFAAYPGMFKVFQGITVFTAYIPSQFYKNYQNKQFPCANASVKDLFSNAISMDLYCLQEASKHWKVVEEEDLLKKLFIRFALQAAKIINIFEFVSKSNEAFYEYFANEALTKSQIISGVEDLTLKAHLVKKSQKFTCTTDLRVIDAWINVKSENVQSENTDLDLRFMVQWIKRVDPAHSYLSVQDMLKIIRHLKLINKHISCLPSEIGQLRQLHELDLSFNAISSLPKELGCLVNLSSLILKGCRIEILPKEIRNLENLTNLDLSYNRLHKLPREIKHLVNLQKMSLDFNELIEIPLEIENLVNLNELHLASTGLPKLPDEIGKLINLHLLNVSGDNNPRKLKELTPAIGKLVNLKILNLDNNNLTKLPVEIGNLYKLENLNVFFNYLKAIPSGIGNLTKLQKLNLKYNQLENLPVEIGKLGSLKELNVEDNRLVKLPISIRHLVQLEELNLKSNGLTNIPPEIGYVCKLRNLRLDFNYLNELPNEIGNLVELNLLTVSHNNLTLAPRQLNRLIKLSHLDLSYNLLKTIPVGVFGNLLKLTYLKLSNNQLELIAIDIGNLVQLHDLDMSFNNLKLIPSSVVALCKLMFFDLRQNQSLLQNSIDPKFFGIDELLNTFRDVLILN